MRHNQSTSSSEKRAYQTYGVAFIIFTLLSMIILPMGTNKMISILLPTLSTHYLLGIPLSYASLYLIAFPIMLTILKKIPDNLSELQATNTRLSFLQIIGLFTFSLGIMTTGSIIATLLETFLFHKSGTIKTEDLAGSNTPQWILFTAGVLIAPIMEEIIFRWLPYKKLAAYGEKTYIVWTSIIFGLFHLNFGQSLYATLLGFLFAIITYKTGSIKYSMILHVMVNFTGGIGIGSFIMRTKNAVLISIYGGGMTIISLIGLILLIIFLIKKKGKILTNPGQHVTWSNFFTIGTVLYLLFTIGFIVFTFFNK